MASSGPEGLARKYQEAKRELTSYLGRMVVRPEVAEELVQQTAVKLLEASEPPDPLVVRPWLFRVATNLALDYLRRQGAWRETVVADIKVRCDAEEDFADEVEDLRGSPELSTIAREHLAVCFSCTLRHLSPEQAAALLLAEVYGFSVQEVAQILEASFGQAKGWIQAARARLRTKFDSACSLVNKQGVCHQCVELSEHFTGRGTDPLEGTARDIDARLAILRGIDRSELGPFHRIVIRIVDDVLNGKPLATQGTSHGPCDRH